MHTTVKQTFPGDTRRQEDTHTIPELLKELRVESSTLIRQEIALAQTELKEKGARFGKNAAYLAGGGLVALIGAIFILFAVMRLLTLGLMAAGLQPETAAWLSPALLGLLVAGLGAAFIIKAKNALAKESFVPEKTLQSLKEDTSWTRTKLKEA
jgi:hypothetical protein